MMSDFDWYPYPIESMLLLSAKELDAFADYLNGDLS